MYDTPWMIARYSKIRHRGIGQPIVELRFFTICLQTGRTPQQFSYCFRPREALLLPRKPERSMPKPNRKLHHLIGLAGVAEHENRLARRFYKLFEYPMLLLTIFIPVQWYLETKMLFPVRLGTVVDWMIWSLFVCETVVIGFFCRHRMYYLRGNWLNLIIIIGGLPLLWGQTPLAGVLRGLRFALLLSLGLRFSQTLRRLLSRNALGITLFVSFGFIVIAGLTMSGIDPAIKSPSDGIWWSVVTMSTVGYGDIVPSSDQGRFLAILLIFAGMSLTSLLTANISAYLIDRDLEHEHDELAHELKKIHHEISQIRAHLQQPKQATSTRHSSDLGSQ